MMNVTYIPEAAQRAPNLQGPLVNFMSKERIDMFLDIKPVDCSRLLLLVQTAQNDICGTNIWLLAAETRFTISDQGIEKL